MAKDDPNTIAEDDPMEPIFTQITIVNSETEMEEKPQVLMGSLCS